jgi:ligand-binding sensor domain-containing protein
MLWLKDLKTKSLSLTIMVFSVTGSNTSISSIENVNTFYPRETQELSVVTRSFGEGFTAKNFKSVAIDNNNIKWFVTDAGIVSFDGNKWTIHNKNRKVQAQDMKEVAYDFSTYGHELWIATPEGATVATIPVDARTGATTYYTENSKILSDNVLSITVGNGALRWFGTDKGVSAFRNKIWLTQAYQRKYPEGIFKDFPITAMATSPDGDSLYVATEGAGVARMFRNKVDAISGASEYAQWGPIEIPSDKVYSICITPDGTQWFGTDLGAARHTGYITMEKWNVFNKDNGLVDNFVQAIAADKKGNIWFGTKGGISVFDGSAWISFTTSDGLSSNNILCITEDKNGIIWIGTDNGVMSYNNNEFVIYR